ncbi:hypothetical protein [Streptomyces sp. URMC 129]|uniref:hypothetical protein n=1 Tax=Streptomyces sp. URMC 129 TaxID=3423407 RepID=UPI003F1A625B
MDPVRVDLLTVLFGPLALIALVLAYSARRSASGRGEPMPDWGTFAQGVAITLALVVAFLQLVWGSP